MAFDEPQNRLGKLLNPPSLKDAYDAIFRGDENATALLEGFHISQHPYQLVWPKILPKKIQTTTRSNGKPYYKELKVFIAAPSALSAASKPTLVRPAVRFHGGGGTTGCPLFPEWMSQADYTYMLKAGDMISVEPEYLLMPESSGLDIIENIEKFCEWLFNNLNEAVRSINQNLKVDWDHLSIFGESFGGLLAMILYLQIGRRPLKPSNLRVSGIILRCPLSELYKREAGLYCGMFMATDCAENTCKEIDEAMKGMPWVELRASTAPPNGMLYAYCSSVCHKYWENCWGAGSLLEMIEGTAECPDMRTRIWIKHGTQDLHVPFESSSKLVDVLQKKWPDLEVHLNFVAGQQHAWDRADPLTDEYRNLLHTL